jgi:hypothetical protein
VRLIVDCLLMVRAASSLIVCPEPMLNTAEARICAVVMSNAFNCSASLTHRAKKRALPFSRQTMRFQKT